MRPGPEEERERSVQYNLISVQEAEYWPAKTSSLSFPGGPRLSPPSQRPQKVTALKPPS